MSDKLGVTYEVELPEGYKPVKIVDAKDSKLIVVLNVITIVVTLGFIALSFAIIRPSLEDGIPVVKLMLAVSAFLVYIVLHELTHGLAYKILTGRKLTFGLTLSVAYCGVPDIYVYRRTALISLLAPLTVFSILFLVPLFFLENPWNKFVMLLLFSEHFGGCTGDIYDTLLLLFKYKDPATLMNDTGPKQTFYQKV